MSAPMNHTGDVLERRSSEVLPVADAEYTVEDALVFIGNGLTQRWLLISLGLGSSVLSANLILMSFLEPNVRCEWSLSQSSESFLSLIVFLGMMIGSNVWGVLSDSYGRKMGIGLSLTVLGIGGIASSLTSHYWTLLACRGIAGVGIGGLATSFTMYAEFLPTDVRGYGLCWYQLFWSSGAVAETLVAWLVLSRYSWRTLCVVTALPALALLPVIALLPESPRYLCVIGYEHRAHCILRKVAAINRTELPPGRLRHMASEDTESSFCLSQILRLFIWPLNWVTPFVWFLALSSGVGYFSAIILSASVRTESVCYQGHAAMDNADYFAVFIDSFAEVPGVLMALFIIERLGRVKSMLLSWCSCCSAMVLLACIPRLKTSILFLVRFFAALTDLFIFIITPELYPSSCRCFATGAMSSVSEIGGMMSPLIARTLLHYYGLRVVATLCAFIFFLANISTLFLLRFETTGKQLKDEIQEFYSDAVNQPLCDSSSDI